MPIALVIAVAVSLWFAGPLPVKVVQQGVVNLAPVITTSGTFTQNVIIRSNDTKVSASINAATVGKTKNGRALSQISVAIMYTPPDPPAQSKIIGLAYDFGPEGATFAPPITITSSYDPAEIPAGMTATDLVIAFYNTTTYAWVNLSNITVDPVTNTISGTTSHFGTFAVIAGVPTPIPTPTPHRVWPIIIIITVLVLLGWRYLDGASTPH